MIKAETLEELQEKAISEGIIKFVAGAYIVKNGKFLILHRAPGEDFLPGIDEIPSGGVDPGETILQGLHREISEETGLEIIDVSSYVNSFDYVSSSGKRTRQFNFLVKTNSTDVRLNPSEHSEYVWVDVLGDNFERLNLSSETRRCLVEAHKTISASDPLWIAIDGIDAVGKTTQLDDVKKKLSDEFRVSSIEEFSSSAIGKMIREIVRKKQFFNLADAGESVKTETLLLIADYLYKSEFEFSKLSLTSNLVLSDRGALSLIAYQATRLAKTGFQDDQALLWVRELTEKATERSNKPDLNICLFLSMSEVVDRCRKRGESLSSKEVGFLSSVQDKLRNLASDPSNRAISINVDKLSRSDVTNRIIDAIDCQYLPISTCG